MRILTPSNSAFTPSGQAGSLPLTATYELTETVNADFGPTVVTMFTPPIDGNYLVAVFAQTISPAGAGTLDVDIDQPGGPFSIISVSGLNLATTGSGGFLNNFIFFPILTAYGDVTISRQVAGLGGGPVTYRITAAAYRVC